MRNFLGVLVFAIAAIVAWLTWRGSSAVPPVSVTLPIEQPNTPALPELAPLTLPLTQTHLPVTPTPQIAAKQPPTDAPFAETLRLWREALAKSDDPVDQIVHALLETDSARREELLFAALQLDPYNTLLNYTLLEHCLVELSSSICGPQYLDMLQAMDADNAVIKDFEALQAYTNGDYDTALRALASANNAGLTDMYGWQRLSMLGESLARQGAPKDGAFFAQLMEESRMHGGPRMAALYQMCQDQRNDPAWQGTCVGRGLALSRNAASGVGQDFGYGLAMSLADNPNRMYSELAHEHQQRRQLSDTLRQQVDQAIGDPSWRISDQQWQQFIEVYSQEGEQAALTYLMQARGR